MVFPVALVYSIVEDDRRRISMESLSIAAVIIMNVKKKVVNGHGRFNQTRRLIDSKVTLRNIKILNISRKSFPFS